MLFAGVDSVVSEHQRPRGRLRFYCRRCPRGNFAFSHAHHSLSAVRSHLAGFLRFAIAGSKPAPNLLLSAQ